MDDTKDGKHLREVPRVALCDCNRSGRRRTGALRCLLVQLLERRLSHGTIEMRVTLHLWQPAAEIELLLGVRLCAHCARAVWGHESDNQGRLSRTGLGGRGNVEEKSRCAKNPFSSARRHRPFSGLRQVSIGHFILFFHSAQATPVYNLRHLLLRLLLPPPH